MIVFVPLEFLESKSTYGLSVFSLSDPKPPPFSYMVTCTLHLSVNKVGYLRHSLGHLHHLFGAYFTSTSLNSKSWYHIGVYYNSHLMLQELPVLLIQKWILVGVHGPNFHHATLYVPDPLENISLLSKKNITVDIKI